MLFNLMELSVQLRWSATVKKALLKYRATCMQLDSVSLEEVVWHFLKFAKNRTENAHKLVYETILMGAEDLEDGATVILETFFLKTAGHKLTKEHINCQQLASWVTFL